MNEQNVKIAKINTCITKKCKKQENMQGYIDVHSNVL